jgi:methionyl-tRNA formyltransferase
MRPMRLLFFGTPEFAVPSLDALAREHEIALVVAQPDKPSGRGMKLHAPAVAQRARELGLPLLQPARVRDEAFLAEVAKIGADAGIVIAYGKILPSALLAIPRHGFFNAHGSVLPFWRGAAPIQRAIEAGDTETGITIMRIDEELDHGPMLTIVRTPIAPQERTPQLAKRLSLLGAEAMARVMREVAAGTAVETPQDHASATFAAKIEKSEGEVRFDEAAQTIYNRFRAFDPWPGLFMRVGDDVVKLTDLTPVAESGPPGTVLSIEEDVVIACAEGALRIVEMQRAGKPRTPAAVVARGLGWRIGQVLA